MTTSAPTHSDPTFRSYQASQAQNYASLRPSYSPELYDTILKYHASNGGAFDLLLDVGCGPGTATRDLALCFDNAVGVDPGGEMIATARSLERKTKSGKDVRFEVAGAEEFSKVEGLEGNVDLICAAMAAHWFDMNKFWSEAAKVLKPGGTVALWTLSSSFCHPSTPNAAKVQEVMFRFERETLAPYELEGNRLSRDMYDDLTLPWTASPPVTAFPESLFVRHGYDREGVLSNGETYFGGGIEVALGKLEQGLGTASMVTRWREHHPDLAGTNKDVVRQHIQEMREALGGETFLRGSATAILLFKKAE
ncbi:S-adenosyl-L-methionine-dependent methyltransferase [Xylogone sp. PMI_703]|nr:S-adenosyl-L-methionine-dependent methyltransferase [Xylogone sp. PMI_703]